MNIIPFSYFCSNATLYGYLSADYIFFQVNKGQQINVDMLICIVVVESRESAFKSYFQCYLLHIYRILH